MVMITAMIMEAVIRTRIRTRYRGGDNQRQDRIQQGPGTTRSQEGGASRFLLGSMGGSCLNCHSQVHGSNHPSGVKLMR